MERSTATGRPTPSAIDDSNRGLATWEEIRAKWRTPSAKKRIEGTGAAPSTCRARTVDPDHVISQVFAQGSNGMLSQPIPLGQMIDILFDFWEADGMFD